MQIVIDIDENCYNDCKTMAILSAEHGEPRLGYIYEKIADGTQLPKGHGRLIDADEIQFENAEFDTYGDYCRAFDAIDQADTIIEADKAESGNT